MQMNHHPTLHVLSHLLYLFRYLKCLYTYLQIFYLLPFEGSGHSMLCLQSIATPALAFILLDPFSLCPDYTPVLRKTELELFAVEDTGALCFYVLCAVKNPVAASTVNLKCPVVINPGTNEARQIIMETEAYDMRHPLADFGRGEEGATC